MSTRNGGIALTTGYVWHEKFGWHDTGTSAGFIPASDQMQPYQHLESAESKARMHSLIEASGLGSGLRRLTFTPATEDDLLRVHTREYVARIQVESKHPRGGDAGDGQSPFGPGGFEIGRLSAGGAIAAVAAVLAGEVSNAYALIRPPGHHARRETGMGFCMFANIPVALEHARANTGLGRVAVVDWDVHHGNGTQAIYDSDPNTLTISIHQNGLFPVESGTVEEIGTGDGLGYTINLPLPAGSGRGAYLDVFDRVVLPALKAFEPELIVVACGFDASVNDPLGRMMLTAGTYRELTARLMQAAAELCEGRLVFCHEGGYSPHYVPFCGYAVVQELSGLTGTITDPFEQYFRGYPGQELTDGQRELVDDLQRRSAESMTGWSR